MNWKSTAAFSSATLLATWLGWTPAPSPVAIPAAREGDRHAAGTLDIRAQADRLQIRVRKELEYRDPTRNPFRFGIKREPALTAARPSAGEAIAAADPIIQPLPFSLSGMATAAVDGTGERTAILTSGSDVIFATQGERVGGFIVTGIDDTGIDVTAPDGSVRRLRLTP